MLQKNSTVETCFKIKSNGNQNLWTVTNTDVSDVVGILHEINHNSINQNDWIAYWSLFLNKIDGVQFLGPSMGDFNPNSNFIPSFNLKVLKEVNHPSTRVADARVKIISSTSVWFL